MNTTTVTHDVSAAIIAMLVIRTSQAHLQFQCIMTSSRASAARKPSEVITNHLQRWVQPRARSNASLLPAGALNRHAPQATYYFDVAKTASSLSNLARAAAAARSAPLTSRLAKNVKIMRLTAPCACNTGRVRLQQNRTSCVLLAGQQRCMEIVLQPTGFTATR